MQIAVDLDIFSKLEDQQAGTSVTIPELATSTGADPALLGMHVFDSS
jgi:hypothetical protein